MKYSSLLIIILLVSCSYNSEQTLGGKLYNELNTINLKTLRRLESEIITIEAIHALEVGDSITLTRPQLLLTNYFTDSLLHTGKGFYLPIGDTITILEHDGLGYKVRSKEDSVGYIMPFWLQDDVSDGGYLLRYKLETDRAIEKRKYMINKLMIENDLTEDQFRELLAKEHFKRTGERTFSY